jgi:hypothetical protein
VLIVLILAQLLNAYELIVVMLLGISKLPTRLIQPLNVSWGSDVSAEENVIVPLKPLHP